MEYNSWLGLNFRRHEYWNICLVRFWDVKRNWVTVPPERSTRCWRSLLVVVQPLLSSLLWLVWTCKSLCPVLGGGGNGAPFSPRNWDLSNFWPVLSHILVVAFCQTVSLCSRLAVLFGCRNQFNIITDMALLTCCLSSYFGLEISTCMLDVSQQQIKYVHKSSGSTWDLHLATGSVFWFFFFSCFPLQWSFPRI